MSSAVYVPIQGSNPPESVAVPLGSLPLDPSDLIGVLTNELAPPSLWLRVALEYFYRGNVQSYLDLLSAITGEEATQAYSHPSLSTAENRDDRIAILCSLAGYETFSGWRERDGRRRQEEYQRAIEHLNAATELDYTNAMTWVGKGLLLLVQGDWDESLVQFNAAIANDRGKRHSLAYVGKAVCLYHKGLFSQAARLFQQALTINPQMDPALMFGLALCYSNGKDVPAARRVLQRLLQLDPEHVDALTASAVLELNELADLNRLRLMNATTNAPPPPPSTTPAPSVQHALALLLKAYALNPSHPQTLLHLASHLFYQHDYGKVYTLCSRALSVLDASEHGLRSELQYQLARSYHAQDDFPSATAAYQLAMKENEEMQKKALTLSKQSIPSPLLCSHPLVTLGYSQMLIHRADYAAARPLLLHLHALYPADHDVLRLLGAVQLRLRAWKEAEELLGRAVQGSPKDVELLCEFATACEQVEGKKVAGKDAYVEAVRLIREEHEQQPPFQLLHNVGVLCQELGLSDEARRWYLEALQAIDGGEEEEKGVEEEKAPSKELSVASVTTRYNVALLLEQSSPNAPLSELAAPYLQLTERFPAYLDAHLRLGTLHQSHSAFPAARQHFEAVLAQQERHLEGRTLLANWLVRRGELKAAERAYKDIAMWTAGGTVQMEVGRGGAKEDDEENLLKGDTYAKLSLASLYQQQARLIDAAAAVKAGSQRFAVVLKVSRSMGDEGAMESAAYWRERAGKYYRSTLGSDPLNVFAAHGLACLLAEQGEWGPAKEVLSQVREARDADVDVALNVGHLHVQQGQFAAAVKHYEDVVHKLLPTSRQSLDEADEEVEDRRTDALLYLARAFFLWGQLDDAVKAMDEAVRRRHLSALSWYNRGLCQEEYAVAVLRKRVEERSVDEVRRAVSRLEEAEKTFTALDEGARAQHKERKEKKREEKERGDEAVEEKSAAVDTTSPKSASSAANLRRAPLQMSATGQLLPPPTALLDCSGCQFPLQEKAQAHAQFCRETLKKAAVHLRAAETRETELSQIAERAKKAKEEAVERQRVEREDREAKEREDVERAEEVARLNKEKLASLQVDWISTRRSEEKDDEDRDAAEAAEEAGEGRRRKGKKKKGRRGSASDEERDEEEGTARRGKKSKRRKTEEQPPDDDQELPPEDGAADGEDRAQAPDDGEAPAGQTETAEAEGDEAAEEVPEWRRMQMERGRKSGVASLIAAPEKAGGDRRQTGGAATAMDTADDGGRDSRSKRRLRRGEVEEEEEERRVRGLDEDDDAVDVRGEEGREAETETVVAEVADLRRRVGRRKAIVEDDDADEGGIAEEETTVEADAGGTGTEEGAVELNVTHTAENEAPIYREEDAGTDDRDKKAEAEQKSSQSVSAEAMDTE